MAAKEDGHARGYAFIEFENSVSLSIDGLRAALIIAIRTMLEPLWLQITTN
jgi:hypothetical protein